MECELCGRKIQGRGIKVRIEGVIMRVCSECAKYGTPVKESRPIRLAVRKVRTRPVKASTRRRPEEEFEIVEDYATRIREAREMLGLTRELLARQIGEKESVIRRIEHGQLVPPIWLAQKLERVLKIKLLVPKESLEEETIEPRRRSFVLTLGDIVVFKERKEGREEA
ncbi:MAG: TIGR00270 family protein [Thermoprotei archaeon]|nr:MAG: TIGR00270 family protein [Thermoprotei archaeon]RLF25450.1 MAG: TIGR00270 family protein [Thermoprotei archaeon]